MPVIEKQAYSYFDEREKESEIGLNGLLESELAKGSGIVEILKSKVSQLTEIVEMILEKDPELFKDVISRYNCGNFHYKG